VTDLMKKARSLAAILFLVSGPACSNDGSITDAGGSADAGTDATSHADGGADTDAGADDTPRFGSSPSYVRVAERGSGTGEEYEGSVSVVLYAEAPPAPHEEVAREGACRLLTWEPAFCDPFCRDGLCIRENECVPWPDRLSAGRVTVEGTVRDLALDPDVDDYYSLVGDPLSGSVFEPGATVTASAVGDEFPAFTLQAVGVAPLVHDFPSFGEIPDGEMEVTWQPSGTPGARIQARFITDYGHGPIPPVVVECESADDGSLVVPAFMVAELADPANWSCGDCFPSTIRRYSRDVTTVGGHEIELVVTHDTWAYLAPP